MTSEMRVADEALEAACDELVSSVLQLGQSGDRYVHARYLEFWLELV